MSSLNPQPGSTPPAYSAADAARYAVEHGQSPEAEAARVLRDFMCCQAGRDLVEHALLRPFGYTLDPGRVVADNRRLRDCMERAAIYLLDARQDPIAIAEFLDRERKTTDA